MQNCWIDLKKMAGLLRNAHQLGQNDDQRSEGMQYLMDHVMSLWLNQSEPVSSGIDLEAFEADDVLDILHDRTANCPFDMVYDFVNVLKKSVPAISEKIFI